MVTTGAAGVTQSLRYDEIIERDIFDLIGLTSLAEVERVELKAIMEETITNRVIARIVDTLPDAELETWNSLATADVGKRGEFLDRHRQTLQRLALEEALIYKYEVAELVATLRTQAKQSAAARAVGASSPTPAP
jgi:hypothetical protein